MTIEGIMTKNVRSVGCEEPIAAAARLLKRENIGCLPVCSDRGKLVGILTDRDIALRCVAAGLDPAHTKVQDIMTRGVYTLSPGNTAEMATETMRKAGVHRLPVVEKGALCGILSLSDLVGKTSLYAETLETLTDLAGNIRHRT